MVNKIRNNTISEIDAKKDLNALKEIKNAEKIKYKKHTPGHYKINNFIRFIRYNFNWQKLKSESQENENEKVKSKKEENEKVESRKEENKDEDYENKYENKDEDDYYKNVDYENEDDDEKIKGLNGNLDEIIDKSKSFEEQIKLLKKRELVI